MLNDPIEKFVDSLSVFASVPTTARARLLQKAITHSVAAGSILFEQGEQPTFQYIVLAGSTHLFGRSKEGREVLIEIVRPGDLVIPAAVVTEAPYLMQARVMEASRFLLIDGDTFRNVMAEEPDLARAIIASLAGQFRRMVRQVKNLKLRSAPQRVGNYILNLSREQGSSDRVVLPFEKNLIASELGMTRESFSRTLSALQRDGIAVQGDTIQIVDMERLAAVACPDPLIDPD